MDNIEKIDLNIVDWRSSREFFESLKDELEKIEDHDEAYSFTWVGKRKSIIEAGAPINKTLRPDVEASKDFDNTKNMLIVGDNLDALKILQESYLGQVKMIYIDPPYNTGHDFIYHDNFTTKKDEYEDDSVNENGERVISEEPLRENSRSNGRFHSDWLSMIYPRLKLARNLLSDDGIIFISIDDNEQANLKKACDEVFGEDNFTCSFIWEKTFRPVNESRGARKNSEYVVCYQKNNDFPLTGKLYDTQGDFSLTKKKHSPQILDLPGGYVKAKFPDGTYGSGDYKNGYELLDSIEVQNGNIINPFRIKVNMSIWGQEHLQEEINKGCYLVIKNPSTMALYARKIYQKSELKPTSLLPNNEIGDVLEANSELSRLLDGKEYFEYPKPASLIKYLLTIMPDAFSQDGYILDFFAGSGTTGHAVMDLNAEDGGNRKYILVQLPEETNEKSEARKAGYETIDQITTERLRRAGDKIQKEHPDAKIDTGFRVFRIDDSNEKDNMRRMVNEYSQESIFDMVDNIKSDRAPLDLLFGAVYASALPFDLKLETKEIGDNTIYLYGYLNEVSGLIACFDDSISDDTIKEIAKLKPLSAVFRDSSFADSAAKINLSEHFRILSADTKVKVI